MRHFGYGIVDEHGKACRSFDDSQVEKAHGIVEFYNKEDVVGSPYRVVELFYKDERS